MLTLGLTTPRGLAILISGTGTTPVTGPGQVVRHGYSGEAQRLAAEPFC